MRIDDKELKKAIGEFVEKLALKWPTLDDNSKQHVAREIAGCKSCQEFLALMNEYCTDEESYTLIDKS